jgi:diguanylate cyclase (GGDEF)-like protein/PAS domain S-box-containing protein
VLQIKTERKLAAIFALAGSLTVLIGIVSYQSVSRLRVEATWVAHTHRVLGELRALNASFVMAESSGAAATQAQARDHLRTVRQLTRDNTAQQARVSALEALVEQAFRDGWPTPGAVRAQHVAVQEMMQVEQTLLEARSLSTARSSSLALLTIAVGGALAVAIAIGATIFTRRHFTRALTAERALKEANATLDERVTARTLELERANQRLQSACSEWRTLVGQAPLSVAMLDCQMRYIATSERWLQEFGRNHESLIGCSHYAINPDIPDRWRDVHRRALAGTFVKCDEELWLHADGTQQWLAWAVSPWRNEAGEIGGIMIIVEDVTPRKRAEQRARLAHAVFESMQEGLFITDLSGRMVAVNPAFRAIMEYSDAELIGQHLQMLRSGRHDAAFYESIWKNVRLTGNWRGEIWNRRKSGEISPQWVGVSTVRDEDGEPQYYVGVCADIGRMENAMSHLQYLAHHDPLTGLANRSLLALRLRHTVERARRDGGRCAVLYLDLDGFKLVNDRLGHEAGDELLRRVARRMSRRLRDIDTLARLGGDEFVLVLEQLSEDTNAEEVARSIISRLTRWFRLGNGNKVSVGVSIGISVYPGDGDDAETLLRRADLALYQAKSAGRGTMRFAHEVTS